MHIIDIIVFLLFTGGVVAFGCSFFKKKGTSEEFTSAGRSLPGWVVGMSIFATYVSSISYRLSGNFWLVSFKISYLCLPLFYETRTTPSCHPSGCAYRQL